MLGNTKGKQLYHYTPDYVLFDLETTGISRNTDEVIEISAVKVRNGRVVDEFSQLVNPGKSIPYAASMVNNITNQMVRNAPHFDRVLEYFVNFIENDTLVGHNICSFDMPFIYRDCERYLGKTIWLNGLSMPTIDNLYALSELFQMPIDDLVCGNRDNVFAYKSESQCERISAYYERLNKAA